MPAPAPRLRALVEDGLAPSAAGQSRRELAREALSEAREIFDGQGRPRADRDATLALRDLAMRADDLPTTGARMEARRILARPTSTGPAPGPGEEPAPPRYGRASGKVCGENICVHWVEAGRHSAKGDDDNLSTVPSQASATLATMESVHATEVGELGYLAPLSDATSADNGGNGRTDVYLAQIGDRGFYGYCASDDPDAARSTSVSAYCVLDNDYQPSEYGSRNTPLENLQVTAAHEYFHAVQFRYDYYEDPWLMEGTAAWIEDEVYDGVNDNLQYFGESQARYPFVPLDFTDFEFYGPYGSWPWWRFLSEWAGPGAADDPAVVRRVWELARGDRYSTSALTKALAERGVSFSDMYAGFGTWMRNPRRYFSEGASYPAMSALTGFRLTSADHSIGTRSTRLDHMSHAFVRLVPDSSLGGSWRARISVDLPDLVRRPNVRVNVHRRDGSLSSIPIRLGSNGNGSRYFDFTGSRIHYLELDLVNASPRFRCDQRTYQSCQGVSRDDDLLMRFNATATR